MSDQQDEEPLIYMPTRGQQAFLSLVGIPMSILSIVGSYHIIRHARTGKSHAAYKKIMMVSSACDIIWSAAWILQPFLTDSSLEFQHEDELWIWSIGNSASCTFLGAMTQFGLSAHWYAGLLSFYFVLTVRFRVKQANFERVLPFLQGFIITWSVGTAVAAAVMGRIHPLGPSPGCWVAGDGFCEDPDCNVTVLLGWIIGGIPTILMLGVVIVNNLILYCHVRSTVMEGQRRAMESQMELSKYSTTRNHNSGNSRGRRSPSPSNRESTPRPQQQSFDSSDVVSVASMVSNTGEVHIIQGKSSQSKSFISRFGGNRSSDGSVFSTGASIYHQKNSVLRSSEKQWKRVQEVGRQSFLYVGAYLLSFGWTFIINFLDSKNYEFQENAAYFFLPLLVCQSLLLPSMGFFNFCVYFRPKILTISREFPNESRIWWVRRVIYGNVIKPTAASARPSGPTPGSTMTEDLVPATLRLNFGGPVAMSSLAQGDSEVGMNDRNTAFEMSNDGCSVIIEGELEESSRNAFEVSKHSKQEEKSRTEED